MAVLITDSEIDAAIELSEQLRTRLPKTVDAIDAKYLVDTD